MGPGKASVAEPGVGEANLEGDSCGDGKGLWLGVEGDAGQSGGYANRLFLTFAPQHPVSYLFALLGHNCHPRDKRNTRVGFCLIAA